MSVVETADCWASRIESARSIEEIEKVIQDLGELAGHVRELERRVRIFLPEVEYLRLQQEAEKRHYRFLKEEREGKR